MQWGKLVTSFPHLSLRRVNAAAARPAMTGANPILVSWTKYSYRAQNLY